MRMQLDFKAVVSCNSPNESYSVKYYFNLTIWWATWCYMALSFP